MAADSTSSKETAVSKDANWRSRCKAEISSSKSFESNWGFLMDPNTSPKKGAGDDPFQASLGHFSSTSLSALESTYNSTKSSGSGCLETTNKVYGSRGNHLEKFGVAHFGLGKSTLI